MYSCEKSEAVMYQRQIDRVSHSEAVMSHSLSADATARSGYAATTHCCVQHATARSAHFCCEQHAAVRCLDCNIVVLDTAAWVESCCSCQWGRVVAVVESQAAERDSCASPRPTRCHHQPQTSEEAARHQWMIWVVVRWRPLHSPTHIEWNIHTSTSL